ncbi:MAG: hypothetical protein COB85_02260 [Bacteroidetes bacterium]|nr:MAG: hypothetical protein COB85_02260 [Bacteroidota bacterium]
MKYQSLFILVLSSILININDSNAQITLTSADYAIVGDSIISGVDTVPMGVNVGGTGAQTWDFTSLQLNLLDTVIFIDPSATAWASDFPSSNLAYGSGSVYYQTSSAPNVITDGFGGDDPFGVGLTIVAQYSPVQTVMEWSSTDGSTFMDTSGYDVTESTAPLGLPVPNVDSLRMVHNSYATSDFDAYGSIDMPGGSYTAIRQLYTENTIDSIFVYCSDPAGCFVFVATLPFGWSLLPDAVLALMVPDQTNPSVDTTYTYKWWANGEDLPVAELETDAPGGNVINAKHRLGNTVVGMITSQVNVMCKDSCSGTATTTGIGGVLPYTYLWSDGQTTSTATGLCDGTYSVLVMDATNDTSSAASVTITEPLALVTTVTTMPDSGNSQGSATVTVVGGTPAYNFLWSTSPPQTAGTATNLDSGSYQVTVTDNNGCIIIATAVVAFVPSCNPISSFTSSGANICVGGDVNFTNSSTNSTSYNWLENMISFATTMDASSTFNTVGTYTISLIAYEGSCSDTSFATVTVNAFPTISTASSTDESACGAGDGSIIIIANGGTDPLQYSIDSGSTFLASGGFTGLSSGKYTVAISDANNCTVIGSTLTISAPGGPTASAGVDATICEGDKYTMSGAMGGSSSSITWTTSSTGLFDDPSLLNAVYTPSAGDILTGSVTLTITTDDPAGSCIAASDIMVLTINPSPTKPIITIAGNTLSSDFATIYQWFFNGDTIQGETGQFYIAIQTGFYTVTISDINGCFATSDAFGYTGIGGIVSLRQIKVHPNPSNGEFIVEIDLLQRTGLSIHVFDIRGQLVYTADYSDVSGKLIQQIDLTNLARGIYSLKLVSKNAVINRKIVIQ